MMHNGIEGYFTRYTNKKHQINYVRYCIMEHEWAGYSQKLILFTLQSVNSVYLKILILLYCYFSFFSTSRAISLRRWNGSVNGGLYCNHNYRKSLTCEKGSLTSYHKVARNQFLQRPFVFNISVGISPVQFPLKHPL